MTVYTYLEARRKLAAVLDEAQIKGKVLIRRRDGTVFALVPEPQPSSPLDIPGIDTDVTTDEIISCIREGRERNNKWTRPTVNRRG